MSPGWTPALRCLFLGQEAKSFLRPKCHLQPEPGGQTTGQSKQRRRGPNGQDDHNPAKEQKPVLQEDPERKHKTED